MSNAIPLLEGTSASGGYLVPLQLGDLLQNTIYRESAVAALAKKERLVGKREAFPVYAGRPTAAFVEEAAPKGVTGGEFGELILNTKKIATNVIYTQELLEDARIDPRVLVSADVEGAFADLIDAHALGYANGSSITTSFDTKLTATTQEFELGSSGDSIATAISQAMAVIEGNGGKPNGIVAAGDIRGVLRDARSALDATRPVFTEGFTREPDTVYGLDIHYTSNLDAVPAGAGKVAMVIGDFSHAILGIRQDLNVRFTDEATLVVGETQHNLWQQNKTAAQWEMRVGFQVHDINRMFVKITNAS